VASYTPDHEVAAKLFFSRIWGKKIIQMFILFFYCS
ncbi:MAG: hypothetical protein ACI976_002144, partial [Aureispira sp.]